MPAVEGAGGQAVDAVALGLLRKSQVMALREVPGVGSDKVEEACLGLGVTEGREESRGVRGRMLIASRSPW